MSRTKRTYARRCSASGKSLPGRTGTGKRRTPSPYLNQTEIRGLLAPGAGAGNNAPNAAAGLDNRAGMFSFLDQWGGLDGIMSTMGKVQKMMRMVQQFGPLLNMFGSFGSFLGGKAATTSLPISRPAAPRTKQGQSRSVRGSRKGGR